MPLLLIPDKLVRESITPLECLNAVEEGFRMLASGELALTSGRFLWDDGASSMNVYAAHVPGSGLGAKLLTACEQNPGRGEPYIHALVTLHDPATGRVEALLDGGYLTALRTAASVAVGARHLARPGSRVLGILGTGLQARTHLLCHAAVLPIERAVVWGRNPGRVAEYMKEMAPQVPFPLLAVDTPDAACAVADVVACTTTSRQPLFSAQAVRPGTHIGVAGPLRADGTEVPAEAVRQNSLFVDSRPKFESLWAPGTAPPVCAELPQVLAGAAAGRRGERDVTIYKPVGMAFQDVVSARIVVDRARAAGSGVAVEW